MYPSCISKCEQKEKAFNNIKHSDSTLIDVTNYLKKKKKILQDLQNLSKVFQYIIHHGIDIISSYRSALERNNEA